MQKKIFEFYFDKDIVSEEIMTFPSQYQWKDDLY